MASDDGSGLLFPLAERVEDEPRPDAPLADRMRPRTLEEMLGQEEVLGDGKPLRRAIEADYLRSMILWGPPGSGKTTLAHVIRRRTRHHFEAMSAVLSGVKELREVLRDAEGRRRRDAAAHHRLHRRDPPLQQGAAGRAARARGVGRRGADRRHHREPLVRGERRAALALPGGRAEAARRRAARGAAAAARSTTRSAGLGALQRGGRARTRSTSWPRAADGDARTALNVLELAVTTAAPDAEDGARAWTWRPCARPSRARRCSTTARARSTSTSSARCTSRCATRTPTPGSTGWRACWRRARTRSTWRAGWCASPPRTSGWPTRRRWCMAMAAQQAVHFMGMPEGALALAQARRLPGGGAQEQRALPRLRRGGARRAGARAPSRCRCGSATRRPAS